MPKLVDHDAQRRHIIECAIPLFRAQGYHALGMRTIAREVGVSKSALYHYYDSKQALFEACSKHITAPNLPTLAPNTTPDERYTLLMQIAHQLDQDFQGELSLLLDYIRTMDMATRQHDSTLIQAKNNLLHTMNQIVNHNAEAALTQLLGILLLRVFDGGQHTFESLKNYCDI